MQSHLVSVVIKLIRVGGCKGQKTTNSVKSFVILLISLLTTDLVRSWLDDQNTWCTSKAADRSLHPLGMCSYLRGKVVHGAGVVMWLLYRGWVWQNRIYEHCRGGRSFFCPSDHIWCPLSSCSYTPVCVCERECVQRWKGVKATLDVNCSSRCQTHCSAIPHVTNNSAPLIINKNA